jgi:hypothetical protein
MMELTLNLQPQQPAHAHLESRVCGCFLVEHFLVDGVVHIKHLEVGWDGDDPVTQVHLGHSLAQLACGTTDLLWACGLGEFTY